MQRRYLSRLVAAAVWLIAGLALAACGQTTEKATPPVAVAPARFVVPTGFAALMQRFRQMGQGDTLLPPPLLYRDSIYNMDTTRRRHLQYELFLSAKPLGLQHQVKQLRGRGYPVSHAVVYQGCLVALFKDGKFGCFHLADLAAQHALEQQLNTCAWQRHWLIDRQLIGLSRGRYYAFDSARQVWQPYRQPVPFGDRPKLYEDAHYLAYEDCHGEFGGTIYFFDKQTKLTHATNNATCANSVWQENGQYRVLSSLGHMMGSADCVAIADPKKLPVVTIPKNGRVNWHPYDTLSTKGITSLFSYYDLQLFGGFRWQGQTVYLMHWRRTTFLVTIAKDRLTIVDPLFSNFLYTHGPITTTYTPNLALTNLDFYALGDSDEVATLLWQGQQLTKIEWGQQPEEMR